MSNQASRESGADAIRVLRLPRSERIIGGTDQAAERGEADATKTTRRSPLHKTARIASGQDPEKKLEIFNTFVPLPAGLDVQFCVLLFHMS